MKQYIALTIDTNGDSDTYSFSTDSDPWAYWAYWYENLHEEYIESVVIYKATQVFKH